MKTELNKAKAKKKKGSNTGIGYDLVLITHEKKAFLPKKPAKKS